MAVAVVVVAVVVAAAAARHTCTTALWVSVRSIATDCPSCPAFLNASCRGRRRSGA